jgi:hypothetical protein
VYDAATRELRLYVNGTLQTVVSYTAGWNAAGALAIGRGRTAGNAGLWFTGDIAEVRAYVGVLADRDIKDLARA